MKKILVFIIVIIFCFTGCNVFAYESDEKRDVEKIEELILREDFARAKARCERFLRNYRKSRLSKRVEDLKSIALKKLSGEGEGIREDTIYQPKKKNIYYIVQAGAFKKYRNAKKLKRSLNRKKVDAVILKIKRGRTVFYRVRVGKFRELKNAKRLVRNLKKKGYTADIINEE